MAERNKMYQDFKKLPESVQELFFALLDKYFDSGSFLPFAMEGFEPLLDCESPIEQMLLCAFLVVENAMRCGMHLISQEDVVVGKKKYRADFMVMDNTGNIYNVIVECDGHEFHEKTKAQVEKNNKRDYELQMAGYEVLHFSGSEIFKDAEQCAIKIISFVNWKGRLINGDI